MSTIGNHVKALRLEAGLTQEQLGDRVGVTKSQIAAIESGRGASVEVVERLADEFNSSIDFIVTGREFDDDRSRSYKRVVLDRLLDKLDDGDLDEFIAVARVKIERQS